MRRPNDLIFQLEHQFTLYLQRCEVTRAQLGIDQLREMRRAFYGGLGQMFFLMTQDMGKQLRPGEQLVALDSIQSQLVEFWDEEKRLMDEGLDYLHATSPVKCECGWIGEVKDLVKPEISGELCKCPKCSSPNLYYKT
jgi:hypothetical protein